MNVNIIKGENSTGYVESSNPMERIMS